jgi:hypothetical protein
MAKDASSKGGWLHRRRAAKRDKARRTGDTPEKTAERRRDEDPTPAEAAKKAGIVGWVGGYF